MNTQNLLLTDRDEIRKLYGKSKETIHQDIAIIKDWLKTQKHLPEIPSDNVIEYVLCNCKFSIEKTKQHLDMHYTVKSLIPEIYQNIHPCSSDMEDIFKTAYAIPLPKLTPQMERVTIIKYKQTDENLDIRKFYGHILHNVYEIRTKEDLCMGDIFIADVKHVNFTMAAKNNPLLLKQMSFIIEKALSIRMKGIYIYNAQSYLNNILTVFKTLLSNKLANRIFSSATTENITKDFPLEILPSDYGGKEKSLDELEALWKAKFLEYEDRFDYLESIKVNETLRPQKLENDEVLGYYGNFKKIETD